MNSNKDVVSISSQNCTMIDCHHLYKITIEKHFNGDSTIDYEKIISELICKQSYVLWYWIVKN